MSDEDSATIHHASRHPDTMVEVLRLVHTLSTKIDAQTREIGDIKLRLERGASSIEGAERQGEVIQAVRDKLIVLETRFSIIWAALAVAGTAAIGGLVAGVIALIKVIPG